MGDLHASLRRTGFTRGARARFPIGTRIAIIGDSRTANAWSGTNTLLENYTHLDRLTTALRGRATSRPTDNYGVGGDTSADILARVATWRASRAEIGVFLFGTNDRGAANLTLQQSIDNADAILAAWTGDRRRVAVVVAELPRFGANALSGTQLANHIGFNAYLRALRRERVKVVDVWSQFTSAHCHDGLHLNAAGAHLLGQAIADVLSPSFASGDVLPLTGGLMANAAMPGTGGSKSGSATGTVATGHTLARSATNVGTVAVAGSKVTSGGKTWQQIDVTGQPTDINVVELRADLTIASAGLAVGNVVRGVCEFEIDAGSAYVGGVPLRLRALDNGSATLATIEHGDYYSGAASYIPAEAFAGVRALQPFAIPASTVTLRLSVLAQLPGTANGATGDVALRMRITNLDLLRV